MTFYERTIANKNFIAGIESQIAGMERQQAADLRVEPVCIAVAADEINFVTPMALQHNHKILGSLKSRLDAIRQNNKPPIKWPGTSPFFG